MATIPLGNFGNAIASPAPRPNITPAAYSVGEGLQRVADKAAQAIGGMMEEQKRQADLLGRARAANSALDHEMAIDGIADEIDSGIASGAIKYQDAQSIYKERVGQIQAPDMSGVDPVTVENYSRQVKRLQFRGENRIGGIVQKAEQVDFRAQTDGILDKLGKQAGLPGSDMAAITAQIDASDEIGRRAYGSAWEKRKQDWKDNSWDARLNQQAMGVRDSLQGINALQKQVTEGEFADKLDSNRRNSLVAKLDAYKTSIIQRNEAAAARAARQQEVALKRAEAEFNTFQSLSDKGTIIAPEYVDRAIAATKGTPYQAGIVALAKQAQETGGLASKSIREQDAALTQIDTLIAQRGRTPELDKRREQIEKVRNASKADLKENGLRAGLERGVITELAPIETSTPEAMAGSLSKRLSQAEHVSAWAGKPVSPLDASEADQVRGILEALPPKQRSAAVATIAQSVGPRYASAISEQLDSKDKALSLAFATAGSKTTAGRFTSELILKGATAIKDGTAMKDDKKVTGWKATIAQEIDGAFPDERAATAVKEASYFIAAGLAAENGGSVGSSDLKRAVSLAIGGEIIERGGKKLPIPAGIDAGEFETRVRNYPVSDIVRQSAGGKVRAGGVEISAEEFATSIPGQELIYAGPGRYAVIVKGRPVTNSAGRPIIIGVK